METQVSSQDRRAAALVGYQYTGEVTPRLPLTRGGYPLGYTRVRTVISTGLAGSFTFPAWSRC